MKITIDYERPLHSLISGKWARYQEDRWVTPSSLSGQVTIDSQKIVLTPTPVNRNNTDVREPSVFSSLMMGALRKGLSGHTGADIFLLNSLITMYDFVTFDFGIEDRYNFIFFPDAVTQQENPVFYKENDTWVTQGNKRILVPGRETSRLAFNRLIHGLRRTRERSKNWVLHSFTFQRQDEFVGCFGEDCSWAFIGA